MSLAARLDPRANSLNAIRLALAVTVIVSHCWPVGGYGAEPRFGGQTPGLWAVYGFFTLSGYLIAGSRLRNDFMGFLRRRILRIYPAFVVCLVLTAAVFAPLDYLKLHHTLTGFGTTGTSPINYVVSNLALRMNYYDVAQTPAGVPYPHAWSGSLWTLYYEFGCYLLVGLLGCWALFGRRPALTWALLAAVTVASIQIAPIMRYAQTIDVQWMAQLLPFFLAGSLCYLLSNRIPCRWWLAAAALAVVLIVPWAWGGRWVSLCALPMTYLLVWLGAVLPLRIGRRHDISYGVYIYGFPVQQGLAIYGVYRHGQVLFTVLAVLCTIPVAAASWLLVERPAMRLRSRPRHRPGASRAAAPDHLPPGHLPPGHLPPGHLPPGHLPPGHLPPEQAVASPTPVGSMDG